MLLANTGLSNSLEKIECRSTLFGSRYFSAGPKFVPRRSSGSGRPRLGRLTIGGFTAGRRRVLTAYTQNGHRCGRLWVARSARVRDARDANAAIQAINSQAEFAPSWAIKVL
jgi:hypothetical protein